mmetsp:Transcript_9257/g.15935  ORF Transcript_9257/g.15935 Transcript_9257/m.15935 type:complete len:226 (-) Transcript_9257:1216-1893(-)
MQPQAGQKWRWERAAGRTQSHRCPLYVPQKELHSTAHWRRDQPKVPSGVSICFDPHQQQQLLHRQPPLAKPLHLRLQRCFHLRRVPGPSQLHHHCHHCCLHCGWRFRCGCYCSHCPRCRHRHFHHHCLRSHLTLPPSHRCHHHFHHCHRSHRYRSCHAEASHHAGTGPSRRSTTQTSTYLVGFAPRCMPRVASRSFSSRTLPQLACARHWAAKSLRRSPVQTWLK